MRVGFFLFCEEYGPGQLVEQARAAEEAGFAGLLISDHYHPWNHEQGQSPFVWSVIGTLAGAGVALPVATAATCPTLRVHPAVVAQAAATSQVMLDGRFTLGVGSGEALDKRLFTLPDVPPPVYVSGFGPKAIDLATPSPSNRPPNSSPSKRSSRRTPGTSCRALADRR